MRTRPLSLAEKQIAREIEELLRGVIEPLKTWLPILDSPSSQQSDYMKDIAFVLLLSCLRETLEQHSGRFVHLKQAAEKSGRVSIVHSFEAFEEISKLPAFIFEPLTENEQILLSLTRDRLVHGYLGGKLRNDERKVKVVTGECVRPVIISPAKVISVVGFSDKVSTKDIRPIRLRVMSRILEYASKAMGFQQIFDDFGTIGNFFEKGTLLRVEDRK